MTPFPKNITFLSDGSECKFINEITGPKVKERSATYVFTKSQTNLGKEFSLLLTQIQKLNDSKLLKTKP